MEFITSCFVRVNDSEKRKQLINWLKDIGYIYTNVHNENEIIVTVSAQCGVIYTFTPDQIGDKKYNCGTNIDLFKALAAMNDENDYMQWHIDKYGNWELHEYIFLDDIIKITYKWRKATTEEIINYFKE